MEKRRRGESFDVVTAKLLSTTKSKPISRELHSVDRKDDVDEYQEWVSGLMANQGVEELVFGIAEEAGEVCGKAAKGESPKPPKGKAYAGASGKGSQGHGSPAKVFQPCGLTSSQTNQSRLSLVATVEASRNSGLVLAA